jgi:hypothetical protein
MKTIFISIFSFCLLSASAQEHKFDLTKFPKGTIVSATSAATETDGHIALQQLRTLNRLRVFLMPIVPYRPKLERQMPCLRLKDTAPCNFLHKPL